MQALGGRRVVVEHRFDLGQRQPHPDRERGSECRVQQLEAGAQRRHRAFQVAAVVEQEPQLRLASGGRQRRIEPRVAIGGEQVLRRRGLDVAAVLPHLRQPDGRQRLFLGGLATRQEGIDALEGFLGQAELRCCEPRLAQQPPGPGRRPTRLALAVARQRRGEGGAELGERPRIARRTPSCVERRLGIDRQQLHQRVAVEARLVGRRLDPRQRPHAQQLGRQLAVFGSPGKQPRWAAQAGVGRRQPLRGRRLLPGRRERRAIRFCACRHRRAPCCS